MIMTKKDKVATLIEIILTIVIFIILFIYTECTGRAGKVLEEGLLNEKFQLMIEMLYPSEPHFKWSEEPVMIDDQFCYEILDYEEVCNKYLTRHAKMYFDKHTICVIYNGGKAYITEGGGGFSGYGGIKFENIKITENTIEADAIQKRFDIDGKFECYMKSVFRLEKVDGTWKIDEFAEVDDMEKWTKI